MSENNITRPNGASSDRAKVKREVMHLIHRTGMLAGFDAIASDGTKPVIVAFEDETIASVVERASWTEGYANLVVVMPRSARLAIMTLTPNLSQLMFAQMNTERLDLHPDSEIGMVVLAAKAAAEPLALRFTNGPASDIKHAESIPEASLALSQ